MGNFLRFQTTQPSKLVDVSENIMSLLSPDFQDLGSVNEWEFYALFSQNTSIRNCNTLKLPVTTLAVGYYSHMFAGCTSLTEAPELPAQILAGDCYWNMFLSCISLTKAPELPAKNLVDNCYLGMFANCKKLNEIRLGYDGSFDAVYFDSWVQQVSSTGTLYYNGADTTRGSSAIPTGWTVTNFEVS